MAKIEHFEDLKVWQASRELNQKMYAILSSKQEKNSGFLINHLFKTSGSIMDNVAEGFERGGNKEFINFLSYSKASAGELRSQMYRALDIEIITLKEFEELKQMTIEISKQLGAFIMYLKKSNYKGSKFSEPPIEYRLDN